MKHFVLKGLFVALGMLTLFMASASAVHADVSYVKASSVTKTNYYTHILTRKSHNYKVYKSGGYDTSSDNVEPIAYAREFNNRKVHITQTEKVGQRTWLKFTYKNFSGWVSENGTDKSYHWLNVPLIAQRPELPTGCEIVATTMMLNFAGSKVTKMQLAKQVPRSRNPNKGFVGSPYSPTGWYIYPKGLLKVVKRHVGTAQNMTGATVAQLKQKVASDHPVVVWVNNVDGFVNHAITISGYSDSRFYYNDPWTNKKTSMKIKTMQHHRSRDGYRALSY